MRRSCKKPPTEPSFVAPPPESHAPYSTPRIIPEAERELYRVWQEHSRTCLKCSVEVWADCLCIEGTALRQAWMDTVPVLTPKNSLC